MVLGDEVEYRIDDSFDYDMFLSHKQSNGAGNWECIMMGNM